LSIFLPLQRRLAHALDRLFNPPKRTVDLRHTGGDSCLNIISNKSGGLWPSCQETSCRMNCEKSPTSGRRMPTDRLGGNSYRLVDSNDSRLLLTEPKGPQKWTLFSN
jgi:hypothetical protein